MLAAPGSGMRRRRICEWTGKVPVAYENIERIAITNETKVKKDQLVTNVSEQCEGDKITIEFEPKEGADFITMDTEFMGKIKVEPTATTKPGKYQIKITRTSTDGKSQTEKMEVVIEAPTPPKPVVSCPLNLTGFPLSMSAGDDE